MKPLIINAIQADGNIRKTLEILKADQLGAILHRYKELFQSRKGKGIESDYILTMVFALSPWSIRGGLQSWVKSDLWGCVVKEAGKVPEEAEFNISLHEALDELELSGAVVGTGFPKSIDMHNPPSLVKRERIKPRTIQRW